MPSVITQTGARVESRLAERVAGAPAPSALLSPEWLRIPDPQRTALTYDSIAKSYCGRDGQVFQPGARLLTGDQAVALTNARNPFAATYSQMFGKSYSLVRQSFLNGRALDFERALASTNLGAGYADGTAMATLNLDTTMTSVLYDNQHLVMWNWLNRVPSINPLYQWTERDQYGSIRGGFGFTQGGVPKTGVAAWTRNQALVCFFGVRRGITDVEAQSGLLGGVMVDPVQEEDRDGAFQVLGRAELNFSWGDPTVTDNYGNTVNYAGMFMQMTDTTGNYAYGRAALASNVLDLQGRYLNFTDLNSIAAILYDKGKLGSFANLRMFAPPSVLEDLSNLRNYTERRILAPEVPAGRSGIGYVTGEPLPGHATNFGLIPYTASIFLDEVPNGQPLLTGAPEAESPAMPTISDAVAGSPTGGQTSYFLAENGLGQSDSGTYYYWVSAVNDSGESFVSGMSISASGEATGSATSTSVAVAAGQVVTLTIAPGPSNGQPLTQARVYRSTQDDVNTASIIGHVAINPVSTPSSVTFTDTNSRRSGCKIALILERTPNNLAIAQMAPLTKYPLAIVQTKVEWLLLLYHVLVIKARQRCYLIKNIGPFSPNI